MSAEGIDEQDGLFVEGDCLIIVRREERRVYKTIDSKKKKRVTVTEWRDNA